MKALRSVFSEASLLPMGKKSDWIRSIPRDDPKKYFQRELSVMDPECFDKEKMSATLIGSVGDVDVYMLNFGASRLTPGMNKVEFLAWSKKGRRNVVHMLGTMKRHELEGNATVHVDTLEAADKTPLKAHELYAFLIRKGFILVGHQHTPGGQKVWQRLAKKQDVTVHGWSKKNEPVNLDPQDPTQTHVDAFWRPKEKVRTKDRAAAAADARDDKALESMPLVASKKIFPRKLRK
jgi:hypothetical protein